MQFNYIPGNIVAPIIAFEVNSGGQFENQARLLLIGHKSAAGTMALDVPTPCATTAQARALAGAGSMLDDMFRLARRNAPAQEIWIAAATPAGTANQRTITIDTVPAAGGQGVIEIAGQPVRVTITAGDTTAIVAASLNGAINAYYDQFSEASLPVTSAVAANVVTCTARHIGAHGAEVDFYVPYVDGGNAFTGRVTVAQTVAGTGAPSIANVLAAAGDDQFDWPVSAFGDDANVALLKAWLDDVSGRWAWNRQIYGHAFYPRVDTNANLTTHGLAQDNRHITVLGRVAAAGNAQPGWQYAAAYAARIVPWLSDGANGNVSRNQTGLEIVGISPPRDRSYWPNYSSRNAWLVSGLSTFQVDTAGRVLVDKAITTARFLLGVPDTTFRDIQAMGQLMYALRFLRAELTYEHAQKIASDDNPANLDVISTTADVRATLVHSYTQLVRRGVMENVAEFANRSRVERDGDNPGRYNVLAPLDRTNPLDVIAANAVIYSQYRAAA